MHVIAQELNHEVTPPLNWNNDQVRQKKAVERMRENNLILELLVPRLVYARKRSYQSNFAIYVKRIRSLDNVEMQQQLGELAQNFKEKREWRMGLQEASPEEPLVARQEASAEEQAVARMQAFLGVQEHKAQGGLLPPLARPTYTLVLDMDETLIHFDQEKPLVEGDLLSNVLKRPYLDKFLLALAPAYELVVFTSALQEYADPILDALDPLRTLFSYRLYRQHCVQKGPQFLKDLATLGRPLDRCLILDNLKENFSLQPENGVFVSTWTGDPDDHHLNDLLPLLLSLPKSNRDVRASLRLYRDSVVRYITKTEGLTLGDFSFADDHK